MKIKMIAVIVVLAMVFSNIPLTTLYAGTKKEPVSVSDRIKALAGKIRQKGESSQAGRIEDIGEAVEKAAGKIKDKPSSAYRTLTRLDRQVSDMIFEHWDLRNEADEEGDTKEKERQIDLIGYKNKVGEIIHGERNRLYDEHDIPRIHVLQWPDPADKPVKELPEDIEDIIDRISDFDSKLAKDLLDKFKKYADDPDTFIRIINTRSTKIQQAVSTALGNIKPTKKWKEKMWDLVWIEHLLWVLLDYVETLKRKKKKAKGIIGYMMPWWATKELNNVIAASISNEELVKQFKNIDGFETVSIVELREKIENNPNLATVLDKLVGVEIISLTGEWITVDRNMAAEILQQQASQVFQRQELRPAEQPSIPVAPTEQFHQW